VLSIQSKRISVPDGLFRFNACIQSMHIIPLVESKSSVVWVGVNKPVLSGAAVLRITKGAHHSPFCIPISLLIGCIECPIRRAMIWKLLVLHPC
jgi:hypothetical protein